ncbi:MAG: energy-coupling factor transporter transmembrane component T family protein, partial [bacterium]
PNALGSQLPSARIFDGYALKGVPEGVATPLAGFLGTLFRDGGEILWSWGFLRITSAGLLVLGSVALKAFLCLCTVNILVLTTAIPDLLQALVTLKTPPLLVAILASMYRYLAVLIAEFNSMRRAAIARNLMSSPRWQ